MPSASIPQATTFTRSCSEVKPEYLRRRYNIADDATWATDDGEEFLTILANKMGKLRKGGEADIETDARSVLYDWQRGRIPFYTQPPN